MKKYIVLLLAFMLSPVFLTAQEDANEADTLRKDALNVYMEASSYIKERITFINYVRDIKVADLVIISTSDRTGSGGREYNMYLEGQGDYAGMIDTLTYFASPDETHDQRREKQVNTLKLGLVRYIIKTPLAKYLEVDFTAPISSEVSTDHWNSWVFRANISGYTHGQSTQNNIDVFGGISASRVTEDWKLDFDVDYSYGREKYDIDDEIIESITKSKSADALVVKSLSDHWSVGGTAIILGSTFKNYDMKIAIMPAIEYDIFPYSESTLRQFRFLYAIGYNYNDYIDSTSYDRLEEGLFAHSISSSYEVIKKWGSIDMSVSWSNYLRDFSENEISLHGSVEWRIAKGLSFNAGGRFSFVNDQINLRKSELSQEEILLGIQELQTDYRYFIHFGFSYTFGSIYNNVVNPRFGGGGGGRRIIIN